METLTETKEYRGLNIVEIAEATKIIKTIRHKQVTTDNRETCSLFNYLLFRTFKDEMLENENYEILKDFKNLCKVLKFPYDIENVQDEEYAKYEVEYQDFLREKMKQQIINKF